jgi:hypothetical protein
LQTGAVVDGVRRGCPPVLISGIPLGVLLSAALLLTFDLVAERRGAAYLAAIRAADPAAVAPGGRQ